MKTININILILVTLLTVQCSNFIDMQPISEIGEGDFYKTEGEIANAVVACYSALQKPLTSEWLVTEFRSDNTLYNPAFSVGRESGHYALDVFTLTSENIHVDEYYTAVYQSIAASNTVLKYVDVVADEDKRNHFEGEVRFLRAYHYFNLVRLFGPVFLVTERISSVEANNMNRAAKEDVYDQIIEDLSFAASNIKDETYTGDDAGRVTSWAAKTLLAKVYLTLGTQQHLQEAKILLEDVMENSEHRLLGDYPAIFDDNNEMNDEIIFAVRYKSNSGGLGNPVTTYFAPINVVDIIITGAGNGFNYPSTELVETFVDGDQRKDANVRTSYTNSQGEDVNVNYIAKYISNQQTDNDSDADWIVLRFADVVLMYSEVINELEGPSTALPYLNEVHARAGLDPVLEADVATKHDFMIALELERRLEFAFENHRWFDLVRTNRIIDVMENHFQVAIEYSSIEGATVPDKLHEWQLLLPIPQSQIDINPNFSQNSGY